MENSGYLLAAFAVIWALVFGYVLFLVKHQSDLRKQVESLLDARRNEPDADS